MTEQDKDTQAGKPNWLDEPWYIEDKGDGWALPVVLMKSRPNWALAQGHEEVMKRIVADHNARLASQDAQDGEWRVGSDSSLAVEERWRGFWNVLQPEELVRRLNSFSARVKELEQEVVGLRHSRDLRSDQARLNYRDWQAAEARAQRYEQALQEIAGNALVDDPCWWARHVLGDYYFADLPSAPQWFKDAATRAALEEATDE